MQNLFQACFSDILYTFEESLCSFPNKYFWITSLIFSEFVQQSLTSTETVSQQAFIFLFDTYFANIVFIMSQD